MRDSTYAGEPITVSDIVQYYYCPRKVYFLKVLGVPVPQRRKMEYGKETHEKERRRMTEREQVYGFNREEVEEVIEGIQIEDASIGLRGKIDVALRLKSGEIVPIDSKLTDKVMVHRQHRKQLHAYAILLDNKFNTKVTRGIIYYTQQKKTVQVQITESDKAELIRDIERIERVISGEHLPRGTSPDKCGYCETRQYCV